MNRVGNRVGTAFGLTLSSALIAALATAGCGSPPPAPASPTPASPSPAATAPALIVPAPTAPTAPPPAASPDAPTAKGEPAPADAPTISQRIAAVKKEYDDASQAFNVKYQAAKSDEERNQVFQSDYPQAEKYVPRLLELARQAKGEPAAIDAYLWILQHAREYGTRDPILATLVADHVESKKLVDVVRDLGRYSVSVPVESFLRTVVEKTPHREVKGFATYSLAGVLIGMAELGATMASPAWSPEMARNYETWCGKPTLDDLAARDPAELEKEAEDLLEDVAKDYKDLKSYAPLGVLAEGDLYELRNLKIGQVAPEITGADVDGVSFKLSDYRGKVVVLDFWGFW
jgi:hypothetical protein